MSNADGIANNVQTLIDIMRTILNLLLRHVKSER